MKKIFIILFLLLLSFQSSFSIFQYEEMDPVCSITGETFTVTSAGQSDTSGWSIPHAYDGECHATPKLSQNVKDSIFNTADSFFTEHNMYDSKDRQYYESRGWAYNVLNVKGIVLTQKKLFPRVQEIISTEIQKAHPDYARIAVLNYLTKTIGYDYSISKPE